MRKKTMLGVLVLAIALLYTSCTTSIPVRHLIPSDIDVSAYRSIAIASTEEYAYGSTFFLPPWIQGASESFFTLNSGFNSNLKAQVAQATTSYLLDAMHRTDYFSILGPETTDAYLTLGKQGENAYQLLRDKGIQALLKSSVTYMNAEEQVIGRDIKEWVTEELVTGTPPVSTTVSYEKVIGRSFYLEQQATISITYTLIDLTTGRVLATDSFTSQNKRETCLGKTVFATSKDSRDVNERCYTSGFAPPFFPLFDEMIKQVPAKIATQLAPSWIESRLVLMNNKPKGPVDLAYTLAGKGDFNQAYDIFINTWKQSRHLPSGYNAALLLEGMGRYDEALTLMNEVYNLTGNEKSYTQFFRLVDVTARQHEAMQQIEGNTDSSDGFVSRTQILTME